MQPRDFQNMQAQAIDFARQMYEKSSQSKHGSTINSNSDPNNFYSRNNPVGNKTFFNNSKRISNILSSGNGNKPSSDGDISLILSLILLLSKDSGDNILLLALLYIMT